MIQQTNIEQQSHKIISFNKGYKGQRMSSQLKGKLQNNKIQGFLFNGQKEKNLQKSRCISLSGSQEFIVNGQFIQQTSQEDQCQFKPSPNIEQYKREFIRDRKTKQIQLYAQNLQQHQINYNCNINRPMFMHINQLSNSKNLRILHYFVQVSYFNVKIKVLNLTEGDWKFQFSEKLSEGMFGSVYSMINPFSVQSQEVAIKVIPYHNRPLKTIHSAVKQYAFIKILSALEIGPKMKRIFGYDLVTTNDSVMFSMQKGTALDSWMGGVSSKILERQLTRLQYSLLLMHGLNICHNDIKPLNIVYSQSFGKLVYIDFGFTEVRIQSLGNMGRCFARGTMQYCSEQMKRLFMTTGEGFVDCYYNDFICLKKSKEEIVNDYLLCEIHAKRLSFRKESRQLQDLFQKKINQFKDKPFTSIVMTYVTHLIQSGNIEEFSNIITNKAWVKNAIEMNIKKACLFFLQVDPTLGLWEIFNKFSDTFITQNHLIDFETRSIVETKLKPYFKTFLLTSFVSKTHSIDSQDLKLHQKILNRFRRVNSKLETQKQDDDGEILDVSEDDEQKLEKLFYSKLRGVQLSKHIQLIEQLTQVFNLRRWYVIVQSDIFTIEKCLLLAGVKVSLTSLKDKSNQGIFIGYLKLLSKYICHIHKTFNLKVIIYRLIKHYYIRSQSLLRIALNLILQNDNKEQLIENDNYNDTFPKQQRLFPTERIIQACRKLLPYEFNGNLLSKLMQILDVKIHEFFQIRKTLIKSQELKAIVNLVNNYLQRYIFSNYDKAVHLYMLSYHQNDYLTYYKVHNKMTVLKNWVIEFRYNGDFQMKLPQMSMIEYFDKFINLMTLVDLIPISLVENYRLIERFQMYVARLEEFSKTHCFDWIIAVNFNAKLVLFSLYDCHGDIMKAIQLGNELIKEHLSTINELIVFNVLNLFERLNNSRKMKLLSLKFNNLGEKHFIYHDNELPIQTALLMIKSRADDNNGTKVRDENYIFKDNSSMIHSSRSSSSSNSTNHSGSQNNYSNNIKECIQSECDKGIIQEINSTEIMWENCMNSKKYSNKFKEKFYFMRSVMIKKLQEGKPIERYLHQFLEEINQYEKFLTEKIANAQTLQISVFSSESIIGSQDFIRTNQILSEFILKELQPLLKDLIGLHHKVSEKGLIESMWQHYETYLTQRTNPNDVSCNSKQSHLQLLCRMNEYLYVQAFMKNKSDPKLVDSQSNPDANQEIKILKQRFNDSIQNYIISFNKQLCDHSFYMTILSGLREGGLMIQGYDSQWTRKQMKSFFLYLVQEKKVFCFFYQNVKVRKFLDHILEISAQEIFASTKNVETQPHQLSFWECLVKYLRQGHCSDEVFRIQGQKFTISEVRSSFKQEKSFLFTVFYSLSEFIFENQCNSYERFFVELILQQKRRLAKVIQKQKYFDGAKVSILFENIIRTIGYDLTNNSGQKFLSCWLIVIVLMPLKVHYCGKITIDELEWMSTFLVRLRINYHNILYQVFFMLNTEYWLNQLCHYRGKISEQLHQVKEQQHSKDFKKRKYLYSLIKLFRKYRYNGLVMQKSKYTLLTIKRIKQKILLPGQNKTKFNIFEKKINCYMRCSLGQII